MPKSSSSSARQFNVLPPWLEKPWALIKRIFLNLFFGRLIYLNWLKSNDREISRAQRLRSRAPSWLRDSHVKLKAALQEYEQNEEQHTMMIAALDQGHDIDDLLALAEENEARSKIAGTQSDESATQMYEAIDHDEPFNPRTQFGLRPAEHNVQDHDQKTKQTQLYLGPIGEERDVQQAIDLEKYRKRPVDLVLVLIISCLMTIGLVMVYSSSVVKAGSPGSTISGDSLFFFRNQAQYMGLGIGLMFLVSRIPYQVWGIVSIWLFILGVIGLSLVFSPLGKNVNGANRWINIGINIQPIEFVKFTWTLLLCMWFGDRQQDMSLKRALVVPIVPYALVILLLGLQPDFGSMVLTSTILATAFLVSGGNIKNSLKWIGLFIGLGGIVMFFSFNHIQDRLTNYRPFFETPEDLKGEVLHNLKQAVISFSSGGFTGLGVGASGQKEYFLPEAHTDFILSITGAEFGFLGVFFIVSLYVAFLLRCIYIARRSHDLFGALVVTVSALMLCVQAFINISMTIGLLPTKGLTLPLISYGGSSILITCFSLGVILNISRAAYPSRFGLYLLLALSRINIFPQFMKWLDRTFPIPPVRPRG